MTRMYLRKPSLRAICAHTLRHTTAHGIPSILRSRGRLQRCCWAGFVLFVLACMVWQCSQLIATFLRYPTQEKVTMVNSPRLAFPAVTFCNLNRARMSKINSSRFRFLANELPFLFMRDGNQNETTSPEGVSVADDRQFAFALSRLTVKEQKELGHQLEDMLISCVFHGEICDQR
ncbi:hypothetical protein NDU88_004761 [Pleurodeles waltl]|uniref:Uncharacterized protein n=1 Tax=Pleurodeles waltl TaxID=8319 RepID=A0AAV7PDH7_PLEWA|nr:hypothetical protein NDU88_004761 [Pleurodeles waltl]